MSYLNLTDEEIITKYQALKKQMNISFNAICVMTIIIGTIVWAIGGNLLVGAIASSVFALLAFMGFLFYYIIDAAELEGLYRNVTREK